MAGQAQLLKNLEGTVGATAAGLTSLETTVSSLNANVNKIGEDLRAFITASMTKTEVKDKPARRGKKSTDDDESTTARGIDHSPSRQRSPRGSKHRNSDDSARSDPGTGN